MKTPKTKEETVAEIMELVMIKILSETVAGSSGCSTIPKKNEKTPAIEPAIKAWTCIKDKLPHTNEFLVFGLSKSPKLAYYFDFFLYTYKFINPIYFPVPF